MSKLEKMKMFTKMDNNELANYYVDLCSSASEDVIDLQILCCQEIVNRFVGRYVDR